MLTLPFLVCVLKHPAPQGTRNMVFCPDGKRKYYLLSRSCLFTYLFCLALRVKWPSRVWDSMKTCEHVSCKGSSHQLQKLVKRHTDSDPKELLNLSDITSVATCIIIQCSDGEPAEDLTYYNPFYEHHP